MHSDEFWALSAVEQIERLTKLAEKALTHWGVSSEPRLIKYRENAVFAVTDQAGRPAALRIHRQNYHSDASLAAELEWMSMLSDSGVQTPAAIAAASGEVMVKVSAEFVPGEWQVDMLKWLSGRPLGAIGEPLDLPGAGEVEVFTAVGATLARLHDLTAAWPRQKTLPRHAWDTDGLVGDEPFWGQFWALAALTDAQRQLFLAAKEALSQDLAFYGQSDSNYGLIHADFVPENVLLDDATVQVIDFDDAGFGWHMFDLVTAVYWLGEEPAYIDIKEALLAGYQSVRSLADRDLETWDMFAAARSLTYLGWVHTRQNSSEAAEMTPMIVDMATAACQTYLEGRRV